MTPGNPFIQSARGPAGRAGHPRALDHRGEAAASPARRASDGVVRYESAHIDGVDSELVVNSSHSAQSLPATIEEVRRILLLHAAGRGARRSGPAAVREEP